MKLSYLVFFKNFVVEKALPNCIFHSFCKLNYFVFRVIFWFKCSSANVCYLLLIKSFFLRLCRCLWTQWIRFEFEVYSTLPTWRINTLLFLEILVLVKPLLLTTSLTHKVNSISFALFYRYYVIDIKIKDAIVFLTFLLYEAVSHSISTTAKHM